jgi:hypothetical protein
MAVQLVIGRLEMDAAHRLDLVGLGRRDEVVQQRRSAREALDPEQLLGEERAVGSAMLRVALPGDAAAGDVVHEGLASCVEEASLEP